MIRIIKPCVRCIIFFFSYLWVTVKRTKRVDLAPKTLLIIRLDGIGDYILFRNFIQVVSTSQKFKGYQITLLGNIIWKDLAQTLDASIVDHFIWIDTRKFQVNLFYRIICIQLLSGIGYECAIHSTYSRDFACADFIVYTIRAQYKIGSHGDLSNISARQKRTSDHYYTQLIPVSNKVLFEFYRNKEFFSRLLDIPLNIKKPFIENSGLKTYNALDQMKYAVLFIGASAKYRKWPIGNFVKIAHHLYQSYGYNIVLCGGRADWVDAKQFASLCKIRYKDLVGDTALIDMLSILKHASFVVSNETSIPHISIALNTPVFVLYNGKHFGRFTPYPKSVTNKYFVEYHPYIKKNIEAFKNMLTKQNLRSRLNIDDITVESVLKRIDAIESKGVML